MRSIPVNLEGNMFLYITPGKFLPVMVYKNIDHDVRYVGR